MVESQHADVEVTWPSSPTSDKMQDLEEAAGDVYGHESSGAADDWGRSARQGFFLMVGLSTLSLVGHAVSWNSDLMSSVIPTEIVSEDTFYVLTEDN